MFNSPFKPNEISPFYQLDQSISILRAACGIFSFLFKYLYSIRKQWRPRTDAGFCTVWSGSALFAHVPQKMVSLYGINSLLWSIHKNTCLISFHKWIHKYCFIFHCYRFVRKVIEGVNAKMTTFMVSISCFIRHHFHRFLMFLSTCKSILARTLNSWVNEFANIS